MQGGELGLSGREWELGLRWDGWLSCLAKVWCNPTIALFWVLGSQPAPQHPSFPSPASFPFLDPQLLSSPPQSVPAHPFPQPTLIQPFRPSTISTTCSPGDNLPQSPPAPPTPGGNSASSLLRHGTLQSWGQRRRRGCSAGVNRKAGFCSHSIPVSCGETRGKAFTGWVGRRRKPCVGGLESSAQAGSHLQVTPSLPDTSPGEVLLSWALKGDVPLPLQAILKQIQLLK